MLTAWELHDSELAIVMARDPRTGCVALWSVAAIFAIPGFMDHEIGLVLLGVAMSCCALIASVRQLSRAPISRRTIVRYRPGDVAPIGPSPARPGPLTRCRGLHTSTRRRRPRQPGRSPHRACARTTA